MPELENVRSTAEAIGRITCIKTGEEIGLLYRWDNGETQAAMYKDGLAASLTFEDQAINPDLGTKRG
ncbi:hypothetical protein [Litoreibacter ponti]|uniref:hypothetical protein n=1 Tax=Litoreibacter ponti TaxID=1510457 RepID=UPI000D305AEB|nr:hypothetical protein [Litoreibacter ponti]